MNAAGTNSQSATLFGHPTGLYTLFFAEMWERFSFYGMKALLLFYMLKSFLKYEDTRAYTVLGAYAALVYMTPFFGGIIADRLLGARRAVVLGGLLMAAGHLMMTVENTVGFYLALGLLITGNGFFKPNISTMVGSLYPEGSPKRDGGFTIFYIGINLGAGIAPLLCGYIGETYGWHYGFGLATIGMLTGIAVFVAPSIITQVIFALVSVLAALNIFAVPKLIGTDASLQSIFNYGILACLAIAGLVAKWSFDQSELKESALSRLLARLIIMSGAVAVAFALFRFTPANVYSIVVNVLVGLAVLAAGVVAWIALGSGGLPAHTGAPPDERRLRAPVLGISAEWLIYIGAIVSIPIMSLLVSGFSPLTSGHHEVTLISADWLHDLKNGQGLQKIAAVVLEEVSKPAGLILFLAGFIALAYLAIATIRLHKIARHRMYVIFILTFFSMLFFSFFEQAASSVNNFTDRNVNRVVGAADHVTAAQVGQTINVQPTQAQLGYSNGSNVFTLTDLTNLRDQNEANPDFTIPWKVAPDNVGMAIADRRHEIPASWFQSVNPVYILIFGLVFTALWGFLGKRNLEPSTPVKFALGLVQVGLGFGAYWYGANTSDERGMVALAWLFIGYLFSTTGELCLSPVGLSMVTRLSPAFLVSTVMGLWFLATAFSEYLAAIIAQFTGVNGGGDEAGLPVPSQTVHIYGNVFKSIAIMAVASGIVCLLLAPLLKYWMHENVHDGDAESPQHRAH